MLLSALDFNYLNVSRLEIKEQYSLENSSYNTESSNQLRGERVYSFLEKITIEEKSYFYLNYINSNFQTLILNGVKYILPSTDEELIYLIPLDIGYELDSFSLNMQTESGESDFLFEIGILAKNNSSLYFKDKNTLLKSDTIDSISFNTFEDTDVMSLVFRTDFVSSGDNLIINTMNSAENEIITSYNIHTRQKFNQYWFYEDQQEDYIDTISIESGNSTLTGILFNLEFSVEQALPTDLEEFINWDIDTWRTEQYEIFRWDLFPDMLLIDTESYEIQSSFFKRLAFFTEKKISAGSLLSDEELIPLHGWNAHDYKADDIARFFNVADEIGFQLNENETLLKEILIENDVLIRNGNSVEPLRGGILSISRESTERLRWLFLTHECYHGLFFSSDEYVLEVTHIWKNLTDAEQNFWKYFLDMYGYNITDEYLLINEFQAYLMQQNINDADSYFRSKIYWILDIRPLLRPKMESLLSEHGNTFYRNAGLVEAAAYSLTGIKAGDLVLKRKK